MKSVNSHIWILNVLRTRLTRNKVIDPISRRLPFLQYALKKETFTKKKNYNPNNNKIKIPKYIKEKRKRRYNKNILIY